MADYNFKLVIGDNIFKEGDEDTNKLRLHGVKFNRKIYQPGEIEAEISLSDKKTVSELTDLLLMKKVKLTLGTKTIAENYYVHEILPQEKNGDVGIFVKLMIYSMDKLMTLDKYSKVYAGMKLGAEILNKERLKFKLGDTAVKVDFERMRMLKYKYSRIVNDKIESGRQLSIEIPSEFIQPYLVQYNESFYDFLSRTANRCGEFLYFEDGKLMLGLKTRMKKVDNIDVEEEIVIKDPASITYKSISTSKLDIDRYARDTMKDKWGVMEETNYDVVKKNTAGYPHDAFPGHTAYNSELTSDEFFFPLYADKFTTFSREMGGRGTDGEQAATQIFPKLCDITANSSDIVDFGIKMIADEAKTLIDAEMSNASKNKKGNKSYFSIGDKDKDPKIDLVLNSAKMMEKGDGNTCIVPFGTLSKDGWTTLDYYRDVRKNEEQLQRDIICIDMGTNYQEVKLGDKIKLSETGIPYTVIQILMVNGNAWTHTYTDYDGHTSPMTQANQNQKIFAIPYLKSKEKDREVYKPYPPVLDVPVVRKAEPQTAFVTDSNDPKLQGRVRIVYPWQTDSTGTMKDLADAEAKYEKAQKEYQEKKQEELRLEKELEVLKKEKQRLKDKNSDKTESLKKINEDIKAVNEKLGIKDDDDKALKNDDITDDLVRNESNECDKLEQEVNELEKKLDGQYADLRKLEAELDDLKAQKKKLEDEKTELERQKEKEKDSEKIKELETQIKEKQTAIDDLVEKISGNKEKEIIGKEEEIKNLKDDKKTADTIEKNQADLDEKRENLDVQRERHRLVQEKKKIQEYYKELNNSSEEDIKKNISDYDSKVKNARDATSNAKTDLGKKEEDITKIKKEVQAAIAKMASPWIRMTSPMATDGGGTIFKPRLGDEVLVNYECGNVERPYVVGSLFSKNVLEPDERINRQVGPNLHKGASIAIVSPNGHGITFKDPSSDSGFAASVYPGIGLINKYIIDNTDAKWPDSKDLAGGIKIGDRYGLYSIDMSSDKRSVKISSSLGTVNLDAFTGITISAPNGDIKIEGKNVSIKAGNNLTLTSGTNIETRSKRNKKFDSGAAFGYTLEEQGVNRLLKEFVTPFIDVSLARSVWEIILMPIEGTTQIKSHRYMKLEAGSGNATIKHDRYTAEKHSGIDDSTKLANTQQLISLTKSRITDISTKIDDFFNNYINKWKNVLDAKKDYTEKANKDSYLIKVDEPRIYNIISAAERVATGDAQEWTKWDKDHHPEIFNGRVRTGQLDTDKETFFSYANALGEAVFNLYKHVAGFNTIYNIEDGLEEMPLTVANALKEALQKLATDNQSNWNKYNSLYDKFNNYHLNKVLLKRKWAALFLMELSKTKSDLLNLSYTEKALADGMLTDNYKWGLFVKNLELRPMPQFFRVAVDVLKKAAKDSFAPFANPVKDRLMWADNSSGQILLSDNPDYTINFFKGKIQQGTNPPLDVEDWQVEEDANQKTLGSVKKLLIDLS